MGWRTGRVALTEWPLLVVLGADARLACGPCSGAKHEDVFAEADEGPCGKEEMHTVGFLR